MICVARKIQGSPENINKIKEMHSAYEFQSSIYKMSKLSKIRK